MSSLVMRGIEKKYGEKTVLRDVDLEIESGEFICVLGPSGCGKSTLLRVLAGLENIEEGEVRIDGVDVTLEPPAKRNFGIVFQSYALFPNMTVRQNIAYGLNARKLGKAQVREQVQTAIELVGLEEHAEKHPQEISGGQQQRVALARAIVLKPQFLLLDEPLSALDAKVRAHLRREIKALHRKLGITTIMVTHDQEEALSMADRIVVMNEAVIEQIGTPEEIYERPKTNFVADFIGTVNFINDLDAIRPEYIRIAEEAPERQGGTSEILVQSGANLDLIGQVLDVEYRGAFYRLTIESALGTLTVDLKSDARRRVKVDSGSQVRFELSQENMIHFERAS